MATSLPAVSIIRKRIAKCPVEPVQKVLMYLYCIAGRSCEAISEASPSDNTTPWGPKGTDVRRITYIDPVTRESHPAAVFSVKTAKREGIERLVAIPLAPEYEPWADDLVQYFEAHGESFVFPFTRQYIHKVLSEEGVFDNLNYPIFGYTISRNGRLEKVDLHTRAFKLHALRHLRASDLIDFYGFSVEEVAGYGGWKINTMSNVKADSLERYQHRRWQGYFPKLLRPYYAPAIASAPLQKAPTCHAALPLPQFATHHPPPPPPPPPPLP